ncbi:MAG: hypothetical protein JNG86_02000 [Verrucomicrobiaceae bacterium]|nr:hypothetical protein [Verrucomicrobiaceae bacterium]
MPAATSPTSKRPAATSVMASAPGGTVEIDPVWEAREQRLGVLIEEHLPDALKGLARDLMDSLRHNAGVAERFDAFCVQAFSKPDWAVPASAVIGELFEDNEERLAELARVPDLVIELGCGQAAVACTVASIWAARGEIHRLARLAESIVAAHGTMKNSAAVEVMLALAATLAVSRPARAEQLFNAALPSATAEHEDAVADARAWLATGKVVCSAPQEIRDLWDTRLRRPRTIWKWDSAEERKALELLAEQVSPGSPGMDPYQRIVPACWWDLALTKSQQPEPPARPVEHGAEPAKHEHEPDHAASNGVGTAASHSEVWSQNRTTSGWDDSMPLGVNPRASGTARVVLGWAAGVFMMAFTALLAPEGVYRLANDVRALFSGESAAAAAPAKVMAPVKPPMTQAQIDEENQRWRTSQAQAMAVKHQALSPFFYQARDGAWKQQQMLLEGHSGDLPFANEGYMHLLIWLHMDPPKDEEIQARLPRLLLERVDSGALALWERLIYPGSPNGEHIRRVAGDVIDEKRRTWSAEDIERLREIAGKSNSGATAAP